MGPWVLINESWYEDRNSTAALHPEADVPPPTHAGRQTSLRPFPIAAIFPADRGSLSSNIGALEPAVGNDATLHVGVPMPLNGLELSKQLIRFRSINPPGEEKECSEFIARLLASTGST